MEFQTTSTDTPPKNLYPCLATITVVPHGTDTKSRRLSTSSNVSGGAEGGSAVADEDGNALRRIISGGRRRTSFGVVADRGDLADGGRRRSFSGGPGSGGGEETTGKWYWRVQAGATDHHLVLLPLSQPPNPVLTTQPQPLSHAMPAHSKTASNTLHNKAEEEHEGIGTKIKKLFRRGSGGQDHHHDSASAVHDTNAEVGDTTSQGTATTATAVDRVIDQTPQGDMLPTAQANAAGATNTNASAETGWPGVINGQHLAAIVVDLHSVDKSRVTLGGGKKNEGSTVTVHVSGIGHPGLERVGVNHHESPKSGVIKFEFDKDWIGAKGEAELLHHYIVTACENLPERHDNNGSGFSGERPFPQAENFQLGSGNSHAQTGQPNLPTANVGLGQEVGPDGRIVA